VPTLRNEAKAKENDTFVTSVSDGIIKVFSQFAFPKGIVGTQDCEEFTGSGEREEI
jgi:hypothetical protein